MGTADPRGGVHPYTSPEGHQIVDIKFCEYLATSLLPVLIEHAAMGSVSCTYALCHHSWPIVGRAAQRTGPLYLLFWADHAGKLMMMAGRLIHVPLQMAH